MSSFLIYLFYFFRTVITSDLEQYAQTMEHQHPRDPLSTLIKWGQCYTLVPANTSFQLAASIWDLPKSLPCEILGTKFG